MSLIYTGIGSRKTPIEIRDIMFRMAQINAELGFTLRSGHAYGADLAFENGARSKKGNVEIFLPWHEFNQADHRKGGFYTLDAMEEKDEAMRVAAEFHPAWDRCSETVRKFHARNVFQVTGPELDTPSDFVICWTPDGRKIGGTATALSIAEYLEVPIFNLGSMSLEEVDAGITALWEAKQSAAS